MSNEFDVLEMASDIAANEQVDASDLFKKHEPEQTPTPAAVEQSNEAPAVEGEQVSPAPTQKKEWTPDPSLLAGMPEMQQGHSGAVYDEGEVVFERDNTLHNMADEDAIADSRRVMSDKDRQLANVQDAMARNGIKHFQIPDDNVEGGAYHVRIMTAAIDRDYSKGQKELDAIFAEIMKLHPNWVYDRTDDQSDTTAPTQPVNQQQDISSDGDFPTIVENNPSIAPDTVHTAAPIDTAEAAIKEEPTQPVHVVLDKSNVSQVSWTPEELEKIKKARTIELNIVEKSPIEFSSISEAPDSMVDMILDTYTRKTNDNAGALPASHYRATFTGLSYAEVIDLSSSQEMNSIDGERKKWSICFNHIKNPSIGPWESYVLYTDPKTGVQTRYSDISEIPDGAEDRDVHQVTKFEDFMRKTSFMDLEFMLWKILCATAMNKELISINCRAKVGDGICGNDYDWVYNPSDLLQVSSINPAVLEEMKETGEAGTEEEIKAVYAKSPVCAADTVTLPNSGLICVYGHRSAYDYITDLYTPIHKIETNHDHPDPSDVSNLLIYRAMTVIKFFLVPLNDGSGKYLKVKKDTQVIKILNSLNEVDWQIIAELTDMMTDPYSFSFSMRDLVCPKCGNKTSIPIESMTRLLFIVAQSLSSVNVTLKKI